MPRGDLVLVTHPDKQPACDFITRSTTGPFVDTGVDVILRSRPGEPLRTERVYLSVALIGQLAQVAGLTKGGTDLGEAELIARGKLEGLMEGFGRDVASLAHTLGRILDDAGISRADDLGSSAL